MSAIADVITMIEGVRVEIAAEREAFDAAIARIREEAEQQVARLVADIRDLETRDRMLVSAIATLHDVAARGRKVGARELHPSPRPSPTRGEGEEARAAAVTDCAIDAVAGAVAGEGGFAGPAPAESIAERLPGEPFDIPVDILERNRKVLADFNEGRIRLDPEPAAKEDVDGRDAPGHDAPCNDDSEGVEPLKRGGLDGDESQASAAEEGPHPGPLPGGEGEDAPPALTPDERTVRAAAAALARPVTPEPVEAAPVELPPPAPARPVPAYTGVGVKPPSRAAPAAGTAVQVPLVDDRPAQPAESVYIAEGQRLADQIVADLPELMRNFPQGPTVGELAREYEAPASLVRDALNRLREQRRAVVHEAKKTGFLHLMPLGSRP